MSGKKSSSTSATTTNATDNRIVAGEGSFVQGAGASWASLSSDDNSVRITDASRRSYTDNSSRYTDNSRTSYTDASAYWNDSSTSYTDSSSRYSYADNSARFTDSSSRYSYTDSSTTDNSRIDASSRVDWYAVDNSDNSVSDDRSWYSYAADNSDRSVTTWNSTGTDPGVVRLAELQTEFAGAAFAQQSDAVRAVAQLGAQGIRDMGGAASDVLGRAFSNSASAWSHTLDASQALMADMLDRAGSTADAAGRLAEVAIASYQPADNKQADTSLRLGMLAAAAVAALVILPKLGK